MTRVKTDLGCWIGIRQLWSDRIWIVGFLYYSVTPYYSIYSLIFLQIVIFYFVFIIFLCSKCIIYLFAWYIKLFVQIDSFVWDIYFLLSSLYNQMFTIFIVLFPVHYYLIVIFNFLFIKVIIFCVVKIFIPNNRNNYLVTKIFFKNIVKI